MSRKYDQQTMQLIAMFEQMTGSKLRDCFSIDDLQVFVVEKGQIGRAVGRAGANVKKLASALKSKIKIIEYSEDLSQFVKNTVHPIKPKRVEVDKENKIALIVPPDLLSRGLLIGRQAIKLRETEKIVQRFFDLTELKVGRPEDGPQTVEEGRETTGSTGSREPEAPMTLGDAAGATLTSGAVDDTDSAADAAPAEDPVKTDNEPVEKSPQGATPLTVSEGDAEVVDETTTGPADTAASGAMSTDETPLDADLPEGAEVEAAQPEPTEIAEEPEVSRADESEDAPKGSDVSGPATDASEEPERDAKGSDEDSEPEASKTERRTE